MSAPGAAHPEQAGAPLASRAAAVASYGKGAELLSLVLLVTLVPRALGPVDYGFFAVATSIVTIGSVTLGLGGPVLMARFVPSVASADRPALARALAVRTAYWRGGLLAVAGVAVVAVALVSTSVPLAPALVLVAALALDVGATVLLQIALALRRVTAWSFRYPLQTLTLVAAVVVLGPAAGEAGILLAVLLSTLVAFVVGIVSVRQVGPVPRWERPLPAGVTRFSLLQGLGSGAMILGQRAGVLAVALVVGSEAQTGFAGLAIGISLALGVAGIQPFVAELPRLSELYVSRPEKAELDVRRLGWLALAALAATSIVAAALAGPLLRLAAGESFAGAQEALEVALTAVPFAAVTGVVIAVAALRLRPDARLVSMVAGLVVALALCAALVPGFEAVGAAAALAGGVAATAVAASLVLRTAVRPSFVCACALAAVLVGVIGAVS